MAFPYFTKATQGHIHRRRELYDSCGPNYPPTLFTHLEALTCLGPHSHVLEIGSGTGQATLQLARLRCSILGVELGSEMAAVTRSDLSSFLKVEIVVSVFEDWPLPCLFQATTFHGNRTTPSIFQTVNKASITAIVKPSKPRTSDGGDLPQDHLDNVEMVVGTETRIKRETHGWGRAIGWVWRCSKLVPTLPPLNRR
jgi:SAM-dependent methyltransferase